MSATLRFWSRRSQRCSGKTAASSKQSADTRPNADKKRDSASLEQDSAEKNIGKLYGRTDYYWPSFSLHDILTNAGFASRYDESKTKFLAGDTAYALTPEEMRNMLGGNLILDAVAARAFTAAGFADAIGCDVGESIRGFGAEECTDAEFSGPYHGNYIVLKDARIDAFTSDARGKRVLTETVDHDRRKISDR